MQQTASLMKIYSLLFSLKMANACITRIMHSTLLICEVGVRIINIEKDYFINLAYHTDRKNEEREVMYIIYHTQTHKPFGERCRWDKIVVKKDILQQNKKVQNVDY